MIELRSPIVDGCTSCEAKPAKDRFCDLVQVDLGSLEFTLCHDCAHELIEKLLGRYYPIWGQALMFSDAVAATYEACAVLCEQRAQEHIANIELIEEGQLSGTPPVQRWHEAECIAAAIRARGDNEQREKG